MVLNCERTCWSSRDLRESRRLRSCRIRYKGNPTHFRRARLLCRANPLKTYRELIFNAGEIRYLLPIDLSKPKLAWTVLFVGSRSDVCEGTP